MKPLATVQELQGRVGADELDFSNPNDVALATHMLEFASAEARENGLEMWTQSMCPDRVRTIVIEAAARGYLNADGFVAERGDMVSLQRADLFAQGAQLTPAEKRSCRALAVGERFVYTLTVSRPEIGLTSAVQ